MTRPLCAIAIIYQSHIHWGCCLLECCAILTGVIHQTAWQFWIIALHITPVLHSPWVSLNDTSRSPLTGAPGLSAHALRLMECTALMALEALLQSSDRGMLDRLSWIVATDQ